MHGRSNVRNDVKAKSSEHISSHLQTSDSARAMLTPMALSISQFCEATSLGRTTVYKLIASGQVEVCRIGRRTLVLTRSIAALIESGKER